jgi:hypothetical protein
VIRYALDVAPTHVPQAEYALGLLLDGIGVAGCRTEDVGGADVVYAHERPSRLPEAALWIPAERVDDWDDPAGQLPRVPAPREPEGAADRPDDVLLATYRLATGVFEHDMPVDAWGVPVRTGNPAAGIWERPLVAEHAARLLAALRSRRGGELERVERWPGGKRWAIVLTHDVDAPFTRAPWSFYARRLATNVRALDPQAALRGVLQAAKTALVTRGARLPRPADDPNFCFDRWHELGARLGAASCFYVAVTSSGDPGAAPADVTYDASRPELAAALRAAADRGCEIGLHASINARLAPARFAAERTRLEHVLDGRPVAGVRHHYWALEPRLPERTLRAHVDAGFAYDSSLGLNDTAGFRRGLLWPFRPFDRERRAPLTILEVPPTLMDGAIFYGRVDPEEGRRRIREHLALVEHHGGAVVLDWHLEQLNPARLHGAGPALRDVLLERAGDGEVWWATPAEAASWWRERARRLARE